MNNNITSLDPIIAVKNVEASAEWYRNIFGFNNADGGKQNLEKIGWALEEEIHQNENSRKQEFSFRDPDGYFITVTEFHTYEG